MRERLFAVDLGSGAVAWSRPLAERTSRDRAAIPTLTSCPTPAVLSDRTGTALVALASTIAPDVSIADAATGTSRWEGKTSAPTRASPTFANGRLYVGADDGTLQLFASTANRPPAFADTIGRQALTPAAAPVLTWTAAQDPDGDALTYTVRVDDDGEVLDDWAVEVTTGAGEAAARLTAPLAAGRLYAYAARARDGDGALSAWSPLHELEAIEVPSVSLDGQPRPDAAQALAEARPGQVVTLGPGTLIVERPLRVPAGVSLVGSGAHLTNLRPKGAAVAVELEGGPAGAESTLASASVSGCEGGVEVVKGSSVLHHLVVRSCTATAVRVAAGAQASIGHVTLVDNARGVVSAGATTVRNSLIVGGEVGLAAEGEGKIDSGHNNLHGSRTPYDRAAAGSGDLAVDVAFIDRARGDLRLPAGQATTDRGEPDAPFDREPRPNGGRVNLGAYGNTEQAEISTGEAGETPSSGSSGCGCTLGARTEAPGQGAAALLLALVAALRLRRHRGSSRRRTGALLTLLFALAWPATAQAGPAVFKVGSFTKSSSTGTQTITHGLGVTPKAMIFWTVGKTNETASASFLQAIGYTTGASSSYSAAVASQGSVNPTNRTRRMAAKALTIVQWGEVTVAEADLSSWNSTSVTLNWTTNTAATGYVVQFLAIGGADVSAKAINWQARTSTGSQSVTGVGFTPDVVLSSYVGAAYTTLGASNSNSLFGFGGMTRDGSQWSYQITGVDNQATSDVLRVQRTDSMIYMDNFGTAAKQAAFTSMDADGFTVNFSVANASASQVVGLALSGVDAKAGNLLKSTGAATATQAVTGVGFTPAALLFSSVQNTATTSGADHSRLGFGLTDGATHGCTAINDTDATTGSSVQGYHLAASNNCAFVKMDNATSTVNAKATLKSFDADGFSLDWTTNDAVQTEILYLALGPKAGSASVFKVGSFTKSSTTGAQSFAHGLGTTPKAMIFWTVGKTSDTGSADFLHALGFTTGSSGGQSASVASQDAVNPTNRSRRMAGKALTIVQWGEVTVAEADVTTWDATNVTLNWTTNTAATGYVIQFLAIGGSDVVAKTISWQAAAATGNQSVTGVGFKPDLVLSAHLGAAYTTYGTSQASALMGVGAMTRDGSQWAYQIIASDAQATSDTYRVQRTDAVIHMDSGAGATKLASFVSMDTDGFTINYSVANAQTPPLVSLALAGVKAKAGNFLKSTSAAPAAQSVTGVGFTPGLLVLASVQNTATTSLAAHGRFGLGASDGTTQGCIALNDTDAFAGSDNEAYHLAATNNCAFLKMDNDVLTHDSRALLSSFGADGFNLTWPANDAVQTQMLYLALGAQGSDRYWIGTTGDSFSDPTKWSTTAGGTNDVASAPASHNHVHYTTGTGGKLYGVVNVKGLTLESGFSGTLNANSGDGATNLTIGSSALSIGGGTLTANSGLLTVPSVTMTAGTLNAAAQSAWTLTGSFTQSGGTFTPPTTSLTVGGDLTLSGGAFTAPPTLNASGNVSLAATTFSAGSGTLVLAGAVAGKTMNSGGHTLNRLTVNASGGTGSWTLSGDLVVAAELAVTAGTLAVGTRSLSHTLGTTAASVGATGTLSISSGSASLAGGLTVASGGTLSFGGAGTLSIGAGKTLTMNGTLSSSSGASETIQSAGGNGTTFTFTVSGATLSIDGLNIKHTDAAGMTVSNSTFTTFKNVAFSNGSSTAGAPYLHVTANTLNLFAEGLSFDAPSGTTKNVKVTDSNAGGDCLVTLQHLDAATNGAGAGETRDDDDDANDDGLSDNGGGVVRWLKYYRDLPTAGTIAGFPTAAFDWNTFERYSTYVALNGVDGASGDAVYVRNGDGTARSYSWSNSDGGDIVGTPRWWSDASSNRYVFVVTSVGRVYKLKDTGSALTVVAGWPYTNGAATTHTAVVVDDTYLFWSAGSGSDKWIYRLNHTASDPNLAASDDVFQYASAGGTALADPPSAAPSLGTVSGTPHAFFATKGRIVKVNVSAMTGTNDASNVTSALVNGRLVVYDERLYYGDDAGQLTVKNASSFATLWSYTGGCVGSCAIKSFTVGFELPEATYPRVYWGNADGKIYAVRQNGTGGQTVHANFPLQPTPSGSAVISTAPLYQRGVLVIGNEGGDVWVINQKNALGVPAIAGKHFVGAATSGIARDPTAASYLVYAGGKLFYLPEYVDSDGQL